MKDKDLPVKMPSSINVQNKNTDLSEIAQDNFDSCVVRVLFKNEQYFKKYKSKLEQFLNEIVEDGENFILEHEFDQSFHIDRVHKTDNESSNANKSIPFYSSMYEDVLHISEPNKIEDNSIEKNKLQTMTCFNCLGDHHMKECPVKIDYQRVNANKKDIMTFNTSRYHEEERKNAIKPGNPSVELRYAMGLKDYQLPPYIYSMRVIGYPPGWMQEAVYETSGLSLYDNSEMEDGHNSSDQLNNKIQYDTEKFVNYPGFNTPVPNGFRDEWQKVGWLPIQKHHQLSEVMKSNDTVSSRNIYKRKCLPSTSNDEIKKSKDGANEITEPNSSWSPGCSSTPKQKNQDHKLNLNEFESPPFLNNTSFSLSKSPGTPIVGHGNPFGKLPNADKFAQDITEHMPFENLPDAVGKFENMRNVLSNVQKKLKELNES